MTMRRLGRYQVCVEKWLNRCSVDCTFDVNQVTPEHPYNNYDCSRFVPANIWSFYVGKKKSAIRVELESD